MTWRQLTDQELFDLQQEVDRRLSILQSQGVMFQGIDIHYLQCLLEEQLGERGLAAAREKHLSWLKDQLDNAEQQIRRHKLTNPGGPILPGQIAGHHA